MPRAIEGYLIGYTSSDKIYRIYIPSQHKVSETRQIHWKTKTIIPLGPNTMEPLITEETYAKVSPPSFLPGPMSTDKPIKQEPEETTNPPTTFQPPTMEPSSAVSKQHLSTTNPETPNPISSAPLPSVPEEPDQHQPKKIISMNMTLCFLKKLVGLVTPIPPAPPKALAYPKSPDLLWGIVTLTESLGRSREY